MTVGFLGIIWFTFRIVEFLAQVRIQSTITDNWLADWLTGLWSWEKYIFCFHPILKYSSTISSEWDIVDMCRLESLKVHLKCSNVGLYGRNYILNYSLHPGLFIDIVIFVHQVHYKEGYFPPRKFFLMPVPNPLPHICVELWDPTMNYSTTLMRSCANNVVIMFSVMLVV